MHPKNFHNKKVDSSGLLLTYPGGIKIYTVKRRKEMIFFDDLTSDSAHFSRLKYELEYLLGKLGLRGVWPDLAELFCWGNAIGMSVPPGVHT